MLRNAPADSPASPRPSTEESMKKALARVLFAGAIVFAPFAGPANATCYINNGVCTGNCPANLAGNCSGNCAVNAGTCAGNCTVNTGNCGPTGECLINTGQCFNLPIGAKP